MPLTINDTPSKGLGAFACENHSAGQLVLKEQPIIVGPVKDGWKALLLKAEASDETVKNKINQLQGDSFRAKLQGNCYEICNDGVWAQTSGAENYGLFEEASRLNHSCQPNCTYHFLGDNSIIVSAISPVMKGEELTLSYCPVIYEDLPSRLKYLKYHFDFNCQCERCLSPDTSSPEFPKSIATLQESAAESWNLKHYQKALMSLSEITHLLATWFPFCTLLRLSFTAKICALWRYGASDPISTRFDELRDLYNLQYGNSGKCFKTWCIEQRIIVTAFPS